MKELSIITPSQLFREIKFLSLTAVVITFPLLIANAEIGQLDMPQNSDDLWLGTSPLFIIEFEGHALCSVSLLRTRLSTSYRFEFKLTALIV